MPLPERIASGVLSTVDTEVVRTIPRQTREVLDSLVLTNAGSGDTEVGCWVTAGLATGTETEFPIIPPQLTLGPGDSYHLTTPIAFEANEELRMRASRAGEILYYLTVYREGAIPSPSLRAA